MKVVRTKYGTVELSHTKWNLFSPVPEAKVYKDLLYAQSTPNQVFSLDLTTTQDCGIMLRLHLIDSQSCSCFILVMGDISKILYVHAWFNTVFCVCVYADVSIIDCRYSHTHMKSSHMQLLCFSVLPEHNASVFPWYGAISSSNKKPACWSGRSSLVSPLITPEHQGGQTRTRGS